MQHLQINICDSKGFLLLEVIVATAILAVAALLLGGALIHSVQNQADAERASTAVFLAQEKAETLKSVPWNQLADEVETEVSGYPQYRRYVSVKLLNSFTKQITVSVKYTLHGGNVGIQSITFERTSDFNK